MGRGSSKSIEAGYNGIISRDYFTVARLLKPVKLICKKWL